MQQTLLIIATLYHERKRESNIAVRVGSMERATVQECHLVQIPEKWRWFPLSIRQDGEGVRGWGWPPGAVPAR